MDFIKRADSNLSISSIASDYGYMTNNDDAEVTTKAHSMQKLLLEAVSDTKAENATLGSEITELLSLLKFDVKSLPTDIKDEIDVTSTILKSEGLSSVNETALQLCLEKRKIENKMKEREERLLKAKYRTEFAKYNALQEKLDRLRKEIEQNEKNVESNRILCSSNLHDYKEAIEKLEKELDTLNSQDIGLDKINEKSKLLMDKLNDLTELNNTLKQYGDLPPSLLQAKNVLESKERELEEVEQLIYDKMNN